MKQRVKIIVNDKPYVVEVADPTASPLAVTVNGKQYTVTVETPETEAAVTTPTPAATPRPAPVAARKAPAGKAPVSAAADSNAKQIKAPMPGTILDINVKPGDEVTFGQQLCALEAMKMKSAIRSPREGVIASVEVSEGQGVAYGGVLVTFE